jgi:hypothetical protein
VTGYPLANANSDEKLKQDIAPSTLDCLSAIKSMPLFQFRWRDQPTPGEVRDSVGNPLIPVGFIAQRLQETHEHLIHRGIDRTESTPSMPWMVNTNAMLATLVGAMQGLIKKNAELEERVVALEGARH